MAKLTSKQQERLAALRRAYTEQLSAKLLAVEEAMSILQSGDQAALEDLFHLAHRLAGSSAIYGFADVARAAGAVEAVITSVLEGRAEGGVSRVQPLVKDLRQAVRRAIHRNARSESGRSSSIAVAARPLGRQPMPRRRRPHGDA